MGENGSLMPITDPDQIAALEAASTQGLGATVPGAITDPDTLARLEAADPNGKRPLTNDEIEGYVKHAAVHVPQMLGRAVSDAAFALPNMAGDLGVGVRNAYGKLTGGQSDFQYPSDLYKAGADALAPGSRPEGRAEGIEAAIAPAVVAGGAAKLPGVLPTILGGATPEAKAASAPLFDADMRPSFIAPNTLTPAEMKRQRTVDVLTGGHELGLSVPRVTSNPTGWNRAVEIWGGKEANQQEFSQENQTAAQRVMARYNGLNEDTEITPTALSEVRKEAGKDYATFAKIGDVTPDATLRDRLTTLRARLGGIAKDFPGSADNPVRSEIDGILGTAPASPKGATQQQRLVDALKAPEPSFAPVVPRGTGPGLDPLTLMPRVDDPTGLGPLGNPLAASGRGPMAAATPGPASNVRSGPLLTPQGPAPLDWMGGAGNGAGGPSVSSGATRSAQPMDPLTLNTPDKTFQSSNIIGKVSSLRDAADVAGRAGQKQLAAQYKEVADALEDQVQREVEKRVAAGDTSVPADAVQRLKDARVKIAKSYTTEDVLKSGGRIDLHGLANKVDNGEPITGDARTLGEFASQFRKATMDPAKLGSRGVNHLEGGMATALTLAGEQIGEHAGKDGHSLVGTLAGLGAGFAIPVSRRMAVNANLNNTAAQVPQVIRGMPKPGSATALAQALKSFSPSIGDN